MRAPRRALTSDINDASPEHTGTNRQGNRRKTAARGTLGLDGSRQCVRRFVQACGLFHWRCLVKLTYAQAKAHEHASALVTQPLLTDEERCFALEHWRADAGGNTARQTPGGGA